MANDDPQTSGTTRSTLPAPKMKPKNNLASDRGPVTPRNSIASDVATVGSDTDSHNSHISHSSSSSYRRNALTPDSKAYTDAEKEAKKNDDSGSVDNPA